MTHEPALKFGPIVESCDNKTPKSPNLTEQAYLGYLQAVFTGFVFLKYFASSGYFCSSNFHGAALSHNVFYEVQANGAIYLLLRK